MCQGGSQLMTGKIIQLINGCFMFEVSGNGGKNKVFLLSNKNDHLYTFLACDFFLSSVWLPLIQNKVIFQQQKLSQQRFPCKSATAWMPQQNCFVKTTDQRQKQTYALSFYRSQNVLCQSKFFESAQNFECIQCLFKNFCAGTKTNFTECKSSFVLVQNVCDLNNM